MLLRVVDDEIVEPDVSNLIVEDGKPVDGIFSERQMRLLTESLYTSWRGPADGRGFVAMANVGLFAMAENTTLVPDVLVSLGVRMPESPFPKGGRSYFIWKFGKPPEVVVEIVSNPVGNELGNKLLDYARIGVAYYIVYDPEEHISPERPLRVFGRVGFNFREISERWFEDIGLGITLWAGEYEGVEEVWLRWCDREGALLAAGPEVAVQMQAQVDEAQAQAADKNASGPSRKRQRAEQEHQRAEQLAAKLRALGVEPDA